MDSQSNKAPLPFAEQLRALQEHGSTCRVSVTDGTLKGEVHVQRGKIVQSRFGAFEGQAAINALLAAGASVQYALSTRPETVGGTAEGEASVQEESSVVPVVPWHELADEVTKAAFVTDDEVTRQQDLRRADSDAEPGTQPPLATAPKPAAAQSQPAAAQPRKRHSSAPTGAFEAAKVTLQQRASQDAAAIQRSHAPLRSKMKGVNTRLLIASFFFVALAIAALWPQASAPVETSHNAATRSDSGQLDQHGTTASAKTGPALETKGDAFTVTQARSWAARASDGAAEYPALQQGTAPETPGGGVAPTIPVRVRVGADGRVREAQLVAQREGFAAHERQALEAARAYRFEPQQQPDAQDTWLTLPVRFRPTPPTDRVVVRGSDTLGTTLMPAWVEAVQRDNPHLKVDIEGLGSTTGFAALIEGSADVATSTRLVRPDELALAERLGIQLLEVFAGYDAIAIVVHPDNPVASLDLHTLAQIYAGRVTRWDELGGADAAIRALGRPAYSGTHRVFRERVLTRLGPDIPFGSHVSPLETSAEVIAAVAQDPNAIGYVSSGLLAAGVRALSLSPQHGAAPLDPTTTTIRSGNYPLSRPLLLYLRPDSGPAAHDLVDFALSPIGQGLVEDKGFVSLPISWPLAKEEPQAAASDEPSELIRVYFDPSSARVAKESLPDLQAAVAATRAGRSVIVVGNTDSSGATQENFRLAQRRAETVASRLRALGSRQATVTIEVAAAEHPIATNETLDGRKLNRRVDVLVQTQTH